MATIRRDHTGKNKKEITPPTPFSASASASAGTTPLTLRGGTSNNSFPPKTNNYLIAQYQHYSSSSPKRPNYLRSTVSSTVTIGVSKKTPPNDNIAPKPTITRIRPPATPLGLKPRLSTNTNTNTNTSIRSPSPFTVKTNVVPRKPVPQTPTIPKPASQKTLIPKPKPVPQKPKILRPPTKDPLKQRASSSSNKPVSTMRKTVVSSIKKKQETRNTTSTVRKEKISIVASHEKVEKHNNISVVPEQVTQPRDQEPSIVECDDHVRQPHYQESSIVEGDDHQTEQVVTKYEKGTDDHKKEQVVTEDEKSTDHNQKHQVVPKNDKVTDDHQTEQVVPKNDKVTDDHQTEQVVPKNDKVTDDHQTEQVVTKNEKVTDDHQKQQVVSKNEKVTDDHQKQQVVPKNEKVTDDHQKEQVVSTNEKGADDHQKEQFVSKTEKGADDHQKEQVASKHEKSDNDLKVNGQECMSVGKKEVETETVVPEASRLLEEPSPILAVKTEDIEEKPFVEEASSEKQKLQEHDVNEVNQSIACEVKLRITCKSVEKDNPPSEEAKKKEGNELNISGIEAQETKEIKGQQLVEEKKQRAGNIAAAAVQKKKEPTVSNDAIEETASKLREQRRNRVKALAGAFETVISKYENK